jgi:hypothetical protein
MEMEGNLPDPAAEGTNILRIARPYCRLRTSCCAVPDISKHGYCGNRPVPLFPVGKVKVRLSLRVKQAYMWICLGITAGAVNFMFGPMTTEKDPTNQ